MDEELASASFADARSGASVRLSGRVNGIVVEIPGVPATAPLSEIVYDSAKGTLGFPEIRKRLRLPPSATPEQRASLLASIAAVAAAAGTTHNIPQDLSAARGPLSTPVSAPVCAPVVSAEPGPAERRRIARLRRMAEEREAAQYERAAEACDEPAAPEPEMYEEDSRPPLVSPRASEAPPTLLQSPPTVPEPSPPRRPAHADPAVASTIGESTVYFDEPGTFRLRKTAAGKVGVSFVGTRLSKVAPGGPGEAAGLRVGMILQTIAGAPVTSHQEVSAAFAAAPQEFLVCVGQPRDAAPKAPAAAPRDAPAAAPQWSAVEAAGAQPVEEKPPVDEWPAPRPTRAPPKRAQPAEARQPAGAWQKKRDTAGHIRASAEDARLRKEQPPESEKDRYLRELRQLRGQAEPAPRPKPAPKATASPPPVPRKPVESVGDDVTEWACRSCGSMNPLSRPVCSLAACCASRPPEYDRVVCVAAAARAPPPLLAHEQPVVLDKSTGEDLEELVAELEDLCAAAAEDVDAVIGIGMGPRQKGSEVLSVALGRAEAVTQVPICTDAVTSVEWPNPDTGDLVSFVAAEGGGLTYLVNGEDPRPASRDMRVDFSGALDFPDTGRGVCLPTSQREQVRILSRIKALASLCGCMCDIPLRLPPVSRVYAVSCDDVPPTCLEAIGRVLESGKPRVMCCMPQGQGNPADRLVAAGVLASPIEIEVLRPIARGPAAGQWKRRPLPEAVLNAAAVQAVAAVRKFHSDEAPRSDDAAPPPAPKARVLIEYCGG